MNELCDQIKELEKGHQSKHKESTKMEITKIGQT